MPTFSLTNRSPLTQLPWNLRMRFPHPPSDFAPLDLVFIVVSGIPAFLAGWSPAPMPTSSLTNRSPLNPATLEFEDAASASSLRLCSFGRELREPGESAREPRELPLVSAFPGSQNQASRSSRNGRLSFTNTQGAKNKHYPTLKLTLNPSCY